VNITTNQLLFDWIYRSIIDEGGDGDAVIGFTHQDYKEVAKQFRSLFPESWVMETKENHIIFYDDMESLILTDKANFDKLINYGPRILTW
jgi:hypothetical protein